jgi:hypothetical protein
MEDVAKETGQETQEQTLDEKQDAFLDSLDQGEDTTASQTGDGTETEDTAGADQDKTEKVAEVEEDASLTPEEKIAKINEILGDDEDAIDAYIKQKGYHNDPAWQKQREIIQRLKNEAATPKLPDGLDERLAEFEKVTKSREYIQAAMTAQGYRQDAINDALKGAGYDVPTDKLDPYQQSLQALGVSEEQVPEENRAIIRDIGRIVDHLFEQKLQTVLPEQLRPLRETVEGFRQTEAAGKMLDNIQQQVQDEGVLDYQKDVVPMIDKFMESNPKATQRDIEEHFNTESRKLTISRLRTSGNRQQTKQKKEGLRDTGGKTKSPLAGIKIPQKSGDFDTDADALFDAVGYKG